MYTHGVYRANACKAPKIQPNPQKAASILAWFHKTAQAHSIKDLEKEKVQAQIWGGNRPPAGAGSGFGSFAGAPAASSAAPPSSSGNGLDDLLF